MRSVLIVGGTGGLGAPLAESFARDGATVTVTGATAAEIEQAKDNPLLEGVALHLLDVRSDESVALMFAARDRLDVLINAAGVGGGPTDFTPAGFSRTIDINLTGTARTCFAAKGLLEDSGGCIVNFGSVATVRGSALGPAYAASKAGVHMLTQSLAVAWAGRVRVNTIIPGYMATPMTEEWRNDPVRNQRVLSRTPAGRWGDPADLVGAVKFLTSDDAAYVNGVALPVDGGYLAG